MIRLALAAVASAEGAFLIMVGHAHWNDAQVTHGLILIAASVVSLRVAR